VSEKEEHPQQNHLSESLKQGGPPADKDLITPAPNVGLRKTVTPQLRRQILLRDGYQCTFMDAATGRRCQSKTYLEVDHRTPVALGGSSDPNSLRTLCRSHNQWEAIRLLGKKAMAPFLGH
jgi:5-methylcytosine-specific restriction endonuclease McrA